MLTKSKLKEIFLKYDLAPLKRLGQNFLIDGNIKDKVIKEARISKDDVVLEIGPGLGALTLDLAGLAGKVIAVEKDRKASAALRDLAGADVENLEIYNEDILKFDLKNIFSGRKIKVVGNLPYYITTPIIEYLIDNRKMIDSAVIMVQREVAARLLAGPGAEDYSSLSCFVRYFAHPEYVYTVKRGSFYPSPDVDSSILTLTFLDKPSVSVNDEEVFFRIVRGAFNQRRKSLINSLSREAVLNISKERLSTVLEGIDIDPSVRPETLSLAQFAKIANAV
jgi:16S rRNA (adenine1518-N6/adenine1519-N6)-dimethyltransferase